MGHPAGYLRRVAYNEWTKLNHRPEQDIKHAVAGCWIDLTVVEDVYGRDDVKVVLESLAALPDRQRQVMAWLYDGHSEKEIAEQLGMKVSTRPIHPPPSWKPSSPPDAVPPGSAPILRLCRSLRAERLRNSRSARRGSSGWPRDTPLSNSSPQP
jgi:FixJ family two-component response regulator